MIDSFGRKISYLRVSVTDRCDLRCRYCMPENSFRPLQRRNVLTFEEIYRIVGIMSELGTEKVRFTGGEALARRDICTLFKMIHELPSIRETALTTNGTQLLRYADDIKSSKIGTINVSLDTLSAERFSALTGADKSVHSEIIKGISRLLEIDMPVKINCVPIAGYNDDEIEDIASIAQGYPIDVRFIELMPIGMGRQYKGITSADILAWLEKKFGTSTACEQRTHAGPAVYRSFDGFSGRVGFISAVSDKFCERCNRVRLTCDGFLKLCLHYDTGIDLKPLLRGGASDNELSSAISDAIGQKPKEHTFDSVCAIKNEETRIMGQIGG